DLAATWAYLNHDWIAANTSGLGLIQIRAYPSEVHRKEYSPGSDGEATSTQIFAGIRTAFQWLTTPIEAAFSAMGWSMSFRNDEEIRTIDDWFNRGANHRRFFETFVFENPLEFAMNWFLSVDDLADMQRSIGAPEREAPSHAERVMEQAHIDE